MVLRLKPRGTSGRNRRRRRRRPACRSFKWRQVVLAGIDDARGPRVVGRLMATVRAFTSGGATITLTGDLEARMRQRVINAEGGMVRVLEAALEPIAAAARSEWYGPRGVRERTGRSGEIDVVTTIDVPKAEARVSIGSLETEQAGGKPRVVYVHSPGALSTTLKAVDAATYWRTPKEIQFAFRRPKGFKDDQGRPPQGFPAIFVGTENAGKGYGALLEKLVKAPARKAIKATVKQLAKAATGA